jgi:hypothetical protein
MLDTAPLRDAYRGLLDAAATVAGSSGPGPVSVPVPPPDEWDADQILAHIVLINAATITAVSSATAETVTTYDNRLAQDAWTGAALPNRIRHRATPALICGVLLFPRRRFLVSVATRSSERILLCQDVVLRRLSVRRSRCCSVRAGRFRGLRRR